MNHGDLPLYHPLGGETVEGGKILFETCFGGTHQQQGPLSGDGIVRCVQPYQDLQLGRSWVLMVPLNLVQKWIIFTSNGPLHGTMV